MRTALRRMGYTFQSNPTSSREYAKSATKVLYWGDQFQSNPTSSREYAADPTWVMLPDDPFQSNPTSSLEYAERIGIALGALRGFNPTRPVAGNMRDLQPDRADPHPVSIQPDQ